MHNKNRIACFTGTHCPYRINIIIWLILVISKSPFQVGTYALCKCLCTYKNFITGRAVYQYYNSIIIIMYTSGDKFLRPCVLLNNPAWQPRSVDLAFGAIVSIRPLRSVHLIDSPTILYRRAWFATRYIYTLHTL